MSDSTPSTSDEQNVDLGQDLESPTDDMEGSLGESQDSASDITNIPETKNQIFVIVGVFSLAGFAAGLAGYFALGVFTGGTGGEIQAFIVVMMLLVGFLSLTIALPVLGAVMGLLSSSKLQSVATITDDQTLVTVGVGVLSGTIVAIILAMFIMGAQIPDTGGIGGGGNSGIDGIGEIFMEIILIAFATAVSGIGAAYINLNYDKLTQ